MSSDNLNQLVSNLSEKVLSETNYVTEDLRDVLSSKYLELRASLQKGLSNFSENLLAKTSHAISNSTISLKGALTVPEGLPADVFSLYEPDLPNLTMPEFELAFNADIVDILTKEFDPLSEIYIDVNYTIRYDIEKGLFYITNGELVQFFTVELFYPWDDNQTYVVPDLGITTRYSVFKAFISHYVLTMFTDIDCPLLFPIWKPDDVPEDGADCVYVDISDIDLDTVDVVTTTIREGVLLGLPLNESLISRDVILNYRIYIPDNPYSEYVTWSRVDFKMDSIDQTIPINCRVCYTRDDPRDYILNHEVFQGYVGQMLDTFVYSLPDYYDATFVPGSLLDASAPFIDPSIFKNDRSIQWIIDDEGFGQFKLLIWHDDFKQMDSSQAVLLHFRFPVENLSHWNQSMVPKFHGAGMYSFEDIKEHYFESISLVDLLKEAVDKADTGISEKLESIWDDLKSSRLGVYIAATSNILKDRTMSGEQKLYQIFRLSLGKDLIVFGQDDEVKLTDTYTGVHPLGIWASHLAQFISNVDWTKAWDFIVRIFVGSLEIGIKPVIWLLEQAWGWVRRTWSDVILDNEFYNYKPKSVDDTFHFSRKGWKLIPFSDRYKNLPEEERLLHNLSGSYRFSTDYGVTTISITELIDEWLVETETFIRPHSYDFSTDSVSNLLLDEYLENIFLDPERFYNQEVQDTYLGLDPIPLRRKFNWSTLKKMDPTTVFPVLWLFDLIRKKEMDGGNVVYNRVDSQKILELLGEADEGPLGKATEYGSDKCFPNIFFFTGMHHYLHMLFKVKEYIRSGLLPVDFLSKLGYNNPLFEHFMLVNSPIGPNSTYDGRIILGVSNVSPLLVLPNDMTLIFDINTYMGVEDGSTEVSDYIAVRNRLWHDDVDDGTGFRVDWFVPDHWTIIGYNFSNKEMIEISDSWSTCNNWNPASHYLSDEYPELRPQLQTFSNVNVDLDILLHLIEAQRRGSLMDITIFPSIRSIDHGWAISSDARNETRVKYGSLKIAAVIITVVLTIVLFKARKAMKRVAAGLQYQLFDLQRNPKFYTKDGKISSIAYQQLRKVRFKLFLLGGAQAAGIAAATSAPVKTIYEKIVNKDSNQEDYDQMYQSILDMSRKIS